MKISIYFVSSLAFILVFAILAVAQAEKSANSFTKIGLINTELFYDEKCGINELAKPQKELDAEVKLKFDEEIKIKNTELDNLNSEIQDISKEIQYLQYRHFNDSIKLDYLKVLKSKFNETTEEKKSLIEKRKSYIEKREIELFISIIRHRIGKAIEQFKRQKEFAIILDISKLHNSSFIIEEPKDENDITKEFIEYYNENFSNTKSK